jgi:folate-dependent phosphoribosylglycinamide formyltransferase PurN
MCTGAAAAFQACGRRAGAGLRRQGFGVTVHFVDEGTGPVVLQRRSSSAGDRGGEVREALRPLDHDLLTGPSA